MQNSSCSKSLLEETFCIFSFKNGEREMTIWFKEVHTMLGFDTYISMSTIAHSCTFMKIHMYLWQFNFFSQEYEEYSDEDVIEATEAGEGCK